MKSFVLLFFFLAFKRGDTFQWLGLTRKSRKKKSQERESKEEKFSFNIVKPRRLRAAITRYTYSNIGTYIE